MAVPDGDAHLAAPPRGASSRAWEVARHPLDAGEPVGGGHLGGGVAERAARSKLAASCARAVARSSSTGRQEARDRAGVGQGGVVAGLAPPGPRASSASSAARSVSPCRCAVMARSAVSRARSTSEPSSPSARERLLVVLLGRRPLAAPLVDAAELALEAGDVVAVGRGRRPARSWRRRRRTDRRASRDRRSPRGARRPPGAPAPARRRSGRGRRRWRTPPGRGRRPAGSARRPGRRGRPVARGAPPPPPPTAADARAGRREQRLGDPVVQEPAASERRLVVHQLPDLPEGEVVGRLARAWRAPPRDPAPAARRGRPPPRRRCGRWPPGRRRR